MSTYYQYQDVEKLIVHKLAKIDGWNVGNYHETEIDGMTDYYSPFYWCGIATKNGFKFVFNKSTGRETKTYTRTVGGSGMDAETRNKIEKLERMTIERGATPAEAETARKKIEVLKNKASEGTHEETYTEEGYMANPPRCNWHIEKDGIIIEKGTGVLKFSGCPDITNERELEPWQNFNNMSKEQFIDFYANYFYCHGHFYNTIEEGKKRAISYYSECEEKYKLLKKFNEWIMKINNICGGCVGGSENGFFTYKEVTKTEYKTEIKPRETTNGSIKDGQCFILKSNFNYGCYKGLVYRIHEKQYNNGGNYFVAYKLNRKHTKECTGSADSSNHWNCFGEKFNKWISSGAISWCELDEVKTPYEVKKVVKEYNKPESETKEEPKKTEAPKQKENKSHKRFTVEESEHTKTHEKIYLVKWCETLSREQYLSLNAEIKKNGGYYSKFTHSFIFKDDPSEILNNINIA